MGDANAWTDEWEIPSEEARPGSQFGVLRLMTTALVFSQSGFLRQKQTEAGRNMI